MSTRMLIIGGAGFIGSHLVDLCLEMNCQVWVYDDFSVGRKAFLPSHPALQVVEGDILNTPELGRTIGECAPDIVYHLAAIHHIPTCEEMPAQALKVNVEGTQSVLSAWAQIDKSRLIFASTGALYDPVQTGPLAETSPVKVNNIYSISKLAGEKLVEYHLSKAGGEAIVARLFNTVGRRETNRHVIPTIMEQLAVGKRQVKLGNLHPRRDYIHVEDVAEALYALGNMPVEQRFDIFNIGSGREYSVGELVELCAEVIGEPLEIISTPELKRELDRTHQLADLTKIQQASGWRPKRTLKEALRQAWNESLEHRRADTPARAEG